MNISLLISGNLTGFGRFFTSPAAKELLGNEKIDLDNHNHLTFLEKDEKAYSITFAKRYIAISQYTQILDSFRRPGKLVVSVLVPRNYMIVPNSGLSKGAVYSLLSKISDRFFEKNFQDGMINQNPAVLGQDYYSEILDGYSLAPSDNRRINEDPSPVKKIGYVRASELDMPSYLDTPYRKSYGEGGYNLVFFAPSAPVGTPNSIDEEPTEVVLYRVRILNTGAILPNPVKLSAPLYKLQAKAGEKAFPIEGTYKDAVDHLLEPRITARIQSGEIVEVLYNFEKDEKTIKFVFVDMATGTPVRLDSVLPSILFADGSRQPISSETFTFRGSEIYDDKKLNADNPAISISPRSERLDLSRLSDNQELKVYVQQGFNLPVDPTFTNLTFTFVNKNTGETKPISNQKMIHLPGSITDWNVYVDTENYIAPIQAVNARNGKFYIQGLQRKAKNVTKNTDAKSKPATTEIAVQTNVPALNLSDGKEDNRNVNKRKEHKVKWHKYLVLIPFILLILGGSWWAYEKYNKKPQSLYLDEDTDDGKNETKLFCYLMYYDSEDENNREFIEVCRNENSSKHYTKYSFVVLDENKELLTENEDYKLEQVDTFYNSKQVFRQILTVSENCRKKIGYIRVSYNCDDKYIQITDYPISDNTLSTHGTQNVKLGILFSQLDWYKEIKDKKEFTSENEKKKWSKKIDDNLEDSEYYRELRSLVEHMRCRAETPSQDPHQNPKPNSKSTTGINFDKLNSPSITLAELKNFEPYGSEKIDGGVTVSERITALTTVFKCINGEYPNYNGVIADPGNNIKNLKISQSQMNTLQAALKKCKFQEVEKKFNSIQAFYNHYNKKNI